MIVGLLTVDLMIPGSLSLKSKRHVLLSLKDKLRSRFNISVAEVDNHDKWQRATLGIAYVGMSRDSVNSAIDKIINFIEAVGEINLTNFEMEIL